MKKFIFVSAIALCASSPAFAQDAAGVASNDFTGPWVAVIGGIDAMTIQQDNASDSARGPIFGGAIGYDFNAGSVIVGIEGEITKSSADFDIDDLLVPGDTASFKSGRDIFVGARVGLPSNDWLFYANAGYVSAQHKSVYDDPADDLYLSDSESKDGFRVGAGAEYGRKDVFGRIELRYQDVGDFTVFGEPTGYARTNVQIVAGVGYRF